MAELFLPPPTLALPVPPTVEKWVPEATLGFNQKSCVAKSE